MKRTHFWILGGVYSLALVAGTSLVWKVRSKGPVLRDPTCFDSYSCVSPGYMAANGVMPAHLSRNNEVAMHERIREYYTAGYRETLPKKYEAELASAGTDEEKKKHAAALASLEKGIDVDLNFSVPRTYKGLDGVVAVIVGVSAFIPGIGDDVGANSNIFFFRREDTSYRLVGVTPVGEDWSFFESGPADMFKRGEAKL